MVNAIKFENIKWALSTNTKGLESKVLKRYKGSVYLSYLDELLKNLREKKCTGIQEKLNDILSLDKLRDFTSELEIAKLLIENGKTVKILSNSYDGMISPPDLLSIDDSFETYIEVKRFLDDPIGFRIKELVDDYKQLNDLQYYTVIELNKEFSAQFLSYNDLQKKEEILEKLDLNDKKNDFEKLLEKNTEKVEIETIFGKLILDKNPKYKNICAIRSPPMCIDSKRVVERLNFDLDKKASKREKWEKRHLGKFYIIAFDFHNFQYDDIFVYQTLFGNSHQVCPPFKIPPFKGNDEINEAIKLGWKDYLLEKFVIPNNQVYIPISERGSYFTNPKLKNVSGLLCKFGERAYFTPNPFAYKEINDTDLLKFIT